MRRSSHLVKNAKILRNRLTPWEAKLWYYLRANRFLGYKFKRQVPIEKYIVDFCCNERKLIVELDGSQHQQSAKDKERDKYLRALGYKVVRFWNNELDTNLTGVLEIIRRSLV